MRIELTELLRTREIVHPSRFTSFQSLCDGSMHIEVVGHPWWLEQPHDGEDRITFHFEMVQDGYVGTDMFRGWSDDEDLEVFRAKPLRETKWIHGKRCSVYCSAPIQDPIAVFIAVRDFLESDDCPHSPFEFLNGQSLVGLLDLSTGRSFLACDGPKAVCDVVCNALTKQGSSFNVIEGKGSEEQEGLVVQLGSARFICAAAYAEFE